MSGIVSNVYSDSQQFGIFTAFAGAIFATVISVIIIIFGISLILKKEEYTNIVLANILSSKCSANILNQKVSYDCLLNLQYTIDKKSYTNNLLLTGKSINYDLLKQVQIKYEKENPNKIELATTMTDKSKGITMIVAALIILGFSWFAYFLVKKFKFLAAVEGFENARKLF